MQNSFKFKGFSQCGDSPSKHPHNPACEHGEIFCNSRMARYNSKRGWGGGGAGHSSNATSTVQMSSRMNIKASHLQN